MPKTRRPLVLDITEDNAAMAGVLGCIGIVTGSALTWATVPIGVTTVTVGGLEANGKLTLLLGVLALAFFIASLRLPGRDLPVLGGAVALGAAAIAGAYWSNVKAASGSVVARLLEGRGTLDPSAISARFAARPGPGLWVVVAGGGVVAVASAILLARARAARREAA
ncbi:MAG: hypothetical protein ABR548_05060 [Actinomycetota bacterium]|nr:hypothetical protein [Actinomycetota bacterium]